MGELISYTNGRRYDGVCAVVYEGSWHKSGGLESYRIKKINN